MYYLHYINGVGGSGDGEAVPCVGSIHMRLMQPLDRNH